MRQLAILMCSVLSLLFPCVVQAQCNCPTPRPMHATATSGILTMSYKEEFKAEKKVPIRVEVRFVPDRIIPQSSIVGKLNELVERLEQSIRAELRRKGFKAEVDFRMVKKGSLNLTGSGFEFLGSQTGPINEGESLTITAYGKKIYDGAEPKPGVFEVRVKLRAKVCVEEGDTHLTFKPAYKRRMAPTLPDSANIPKHILDQKKKAFDAKTQVEVDRIKSALAATQKKLTERQRLAIWSGTANEFEVKVPITFFGKQYDLPIKVTPLRQVRICSNTIGD